MKRYRNLYKNICYINNIKDSFKKVCKNTKNKLRVANPKEYKTIYISRVHQILENIYYVRYQYDFVLFHSSKEYLKDCLEQIKEFLKK